LVSGFASALASGFAAGAAAGAAGFTTGFGGIGGQSFEAGKRDGWQADSGKTAPGAWFEDDGCIAVLMPGVPREMKAMWAEDIRPVLLQRQNCTIHSKTLRVLGAKAALPARFPRCSPAKTPRQPFIAKPARARSV